MIWHIPGKEGLLEKAYTSSGRKLQCRWFPVFCPSFLDSSAGGKCTLRGVVKAFGPRVFRWDISVAGNDVLAELSDCTVVALTSSLVSNGWRLLISLLLLCMQLLAVFTLDESNTWPNSSWFLWNFLQDDPSCLRISDLRSALGQTADTPLQDLDGDSADYPKRYFTMTDNVPRISLSISAQMLKAGK